MNAGRPSGPGQLAHRGRRAGGWSAGWRRCRRPRHSRRAWNLPGGRGCVAVERCGVDADQHRAHGEHIAFAAVRFDDPPRVGLGSSTSALAVSTEHSTWLSSTSSPRRRSSASRSLPAILRPDREPGRTSPARRRSRLPQRPLDTVQQPVGARQPRSFQPRRRIRVSNPQARNTGASNS